MPFKIYHKELEKVPEFRGFNDFIATFPLYRGKTKSKDDEDDDGNVGEFKVMDINFCMGFCQTFNLMEEVSVSKTLCSTSQRTKGFTLVNQVIAV